MANMKKAGTSKSNGFWTALPFWSMASSEP